MKKKFKHSELNEKRSHKKGGLFGSEERVREAAKIQSDDEWQLILQLCDEYNIKNDEHFWVNLALSLARDFVPAFQEKKRPGPEVKWTPYRRGILAVEIERLLKSRSCTIAHAADVLATKRPWKDNIQAKEKMGASGNEIDSVTPDPGEALRRIYHESQNTKWTKITRKAYKWHEELGTLSDWDAIVMDAFKH